MFWRQVLAPESDDKQSDRDAGHAEHFRLLAEEGRSWSGNEPDVFFQNRGDGTFDEVGALLGLDIRADGRGAATADLDGDGDEDLVLVNRNTPTVQVLRNDITGQGAVFQVAIDAVGAQVTVECDGRTWTKQTSAGSGLLSQSGGPLSFGLGACREVGAVTIRHAGTTRTLPGPHPVDHRLRLGADGTPLTMTSIRPRNWNRGTGASTGALSAPQPELGFEGLGRDGVTIGPDTEGVLVLNFWATWCSACEREKPDLLALRQRFAGRARFLQVSLDEPSSGKPEAADLAPFGDGFEQLRGAPADQRVYAELAGVKPGVAPLTAVVVDGVIRHVEVGAMNPKTMSEALDAALAR